MSDIHINVTKTNQNLSVQHRLSTVKMLTVIFIVLI